MKYVRKTHKHTAHTVREYVAFHEHSKKCTSILYVYTLDPPFLHAGAVNTHHSVSKQSISLFTSYFKSCLHLNQLLIKLCYLPLKQALLSLLTCTDTDVDIDLVLCIGM